jgi:hypothetical protein
MLGLVPSIHALRRVERMESAKAPAAPSHRVVKTWMVGTRPAMTGVVPYVAPGSVEIARGMDEFGRDGHGGSRIACFWT